MFTDHDGINEMLEAWKVLGHDRIYYRSGNKLNTLENEK